MDPDHFEISPLYVEVITIQPGKQPKRKVINHNDRDDRQWLGKHCFWAFRNGVEIRTKAVPHSC